MTENKRERLERNLVSFAHGIVTESAMKIENKAKRISEIIASMSGYKAPEGPVDPVDPVDPPNGYEPVVEQAHYGLFVFNWATWKLWDPATRVEWVKELRKTIEHIRKLCFAVHEIFLWVSSGRSSESHYNKKLPWKMVKGKVDFNQWEEKWWTIYTIFLKIHKRLGIKIMMTLFMREMYTRWALANAVGGPKDFFSDEMFAVWRRYARRLILEYHLVYGEDATPFIKISNEWNHHGRGPGANKNERGYIFAMFHVRLFTAIQDLLQGKTTQEKLNYIVGDPTQSEWVVNCFTEPHDAPGGYTVGEWRFVGPKPKKARRVRRDEHGYTVIENYTTKQFQVICTNWHWLTAPFGCSEDGGSGYHMVNGKRVYYGKGPRIGRHAVGTADQVREANKYGQAMAIRNGRPLSHTFMNIECLLGGKEDCSDDTLKLRGSWNRAYYFVLGIIEGKIA